MTLNITDFKRIKKAEVETKGITLVVGSNSGGKSTLLKGLKAVLNNQTTDRQFRYGTKGFKVEIGLDEQIVTYTRTKANRLVTLLSADDPELSEFRKLDKDTLAEIIPSFPLKVLTLKDTKFLPNIVSQGQVPIFSQIDITDLFSVLYEDVARLTKRLDDLKKALSVSNKELADLDAQIRFCDEGTAKIEEKLKLMDGPSIEKFAPAFRQMMEILDKIQTSAWNLNKVESEFSTFQDLVALGSDLETPRALLEKVSRGQDSAARIGTLDFQVQEIKDRLSKAETYLKGTDKVEEACMRLAKAKRSMGILARLEIELQKLKSEDLGSLPQISEDEMVNIPILIHKLRSGSQAAAKMAVLNFKMAPLAQLNVALASIETVGYRVESILKYLTTLKAIRDCEALIQEQDKQTQDLLKTLAESKNCPLCGSEVDLTEALHVHAH